MHKISITIISLCFFLLLTSNAYSQEVYFKTSDKPLAAGVYKHKKAIKKSYKTFYESEAERKFLKKLMKDDGLKELLGVYKLADRENEAFEYCPKLGCIIETGGHGYISVYDLKNKKEICSNPSTYVYSPSKKYRFGSLHNDGIKYFLEEKVGDNYICHDLCRDSHFPGNFYSIYWVDDETIFFLKDEENNDGSMHQAAYSAKIRIKTN